MFVEVRPTPAQAATVPAYNHVFVIVMENHSYSDVVGNTSAPYFNNLIASGALASSYYAVTHPSLPNYLAMVGGSTYGVTSDCTTCYVSAASLADRVEAAGKSWKAYQESMPSACYLGSTYPYAQKHNPLIYFNNIRTNATRCRSRIVPYTQLRTDLAYASTTPAFGFITPNMCNDTHDCSVATGDAWLKAQVPMLLASPAFKTQRSLLVVTWDEDDSSSSNHIPLLMLGSGVRAGYVSSTSYNHYSLLHTIEATLGAGTITANDANAALMADMFGAPVRCTAAKLTPATGTAAVGAVISFTTTATGCTSPVFEVWLRDPLGTWYLMRGWGAGTFKWTTTGAMKGAFRFSVWANQSGTFMGRPQAYATSNFTLG